MERNLHIKNSIFLNQDLLRTLGFNLKEGTVLVAVRIIKDYAVREFKKSMLKYSTEDFLNKDKVKEINELYDSIFYTGNSKNVIGESLFSDFNEIGAEFIKKHKKQIKKRLKNYIETEGLSQKDLRNIKKAFTRYVIENIAGKGSIEYVKRYPLTRALSSTNNYRKFYKNSENVLRDNAEVRYTSYLLSHIEDNMEKYISKGERISVYIDIFSKIKSKVRMFEGLFPEGTLLISSKQLKNVIVDIEKRLNSTESEIQYILEESIDRLLEDTQA